MVWNKLCFVQITQWDLQNKGKSGRTGTSSATALHVFASQHNCFRTTRPDCAIAFGRYVTVDGGNLCHVSVGQSIY